MARIPEPSPWLPGSEPEPAAAFAPPMPPVPPDPPLDDEPDDEEHDPVRSPPPSWRPSEPPSPATRRSAWPRLPLAGLGIPSGAVAKFEANLAAIDTLHQLEATDAESGDDMRAKLLRYTGWGGLPAAGHVWHEPSGARAALSAAAPLACRNGAGTVSAIRIVDLHRRVPSTPDGIAQHSHAGFPRFDIHTVSG